MLEELRGHVFVHWIGLREFQRHGKHGEAIKSHPRSAVRLLQKSAGRQRFRAVENARVIEPEETAGEKIVAFGVFAVHPPGEIEQQLLECAFKKSAITLPARTSHLVNAPGGPGVDGRIHITKSKFVSRHLAVRMHVPFAQEKIELLLREVWIDFRKWNHVECEVPCREPGIFPFVRHRDDVAVEKMSPFAVAAEVSLLGWRRLRGISSEPIANRVMIKLFAPEQPGIALASNLSRFLIRLRWNDCVVKLLRLFHSLREYAIEISERLRRRFVFRR